MAQKKRSSWGCVQEQRKDVWRIRYRVGSERLSTTVYGTRKMAELRLAELRTEHDLGRNQKRIPTVRELWSRDIWPTIEAGRKNTAYAYRAAWKKIDAKFGGLHVDRVNAADVQDWIVDQAGGAAGIILCALRKVTSRAAMLGICSDALTGVRFTTAEPVHRDRTPVRDMAPYLDAVRGGHMEAAVIMMACAGLRVGEALAVRVDAIRREGGAVTIAVTDTVDNSGHLQGNVKTRESLRTAALAGPWADRLMELVAARLDAGDEYMTPDGDGGAMGKETARSLWYEATDAANLPRVTLQVLRPSFATAALDAGASARDVNVLMGHVSLSPILQTYDRPAAPIHAAPTLWDKLGHTNA